MACEACGGCGVLITSWDTLGEPQDGKVFVDTCDMCTTGKMGRHRGHAAEAVARALKTDILLVRDDWGDGKPASFKDAIVAPIKDVEALLERWNAGGRWLCGVL